MEKVDYRLIVVKVKKGKNVNGFLQQLHKANIKIKNVSFNEDVIQFEIARKDLPKLKKIRQKLKVKISIQSGALSIVLQKNGWVMLGIIFFIFLPIVLSQFIWKVEVDAETPELRKTVEEVVDEQLKLNKPILKRNMLSDFEIRQKIMEEVRDLSWVHIIKTGSHIKIIPQKAPVNNLKSTKSNQLHHLIASKSGVITHFDITKGERSVNVHSTVHKGDLLVSGVITQGEKEIMIGAEGEVFADYWLETDFTIPKRVQYIQPVGMEWVVQINNNKKEEGSYFQKITLPKWLDPFVEIKKIQNYTLNTEQLTEDQVESLILPLLHEKILQSLPPKSAIKRENLLHVTFDDDKVEGKVLFLINENIAIPAPIKEHKQESAENLRRD